MTNPRWKHRPPGSNWGDFGPDDQLGRLNLLTREKLRQGLAAATQGIAFCLSLPLDFPGGNAGRSAALPAEAAADLARRQDEFQLPAREDGVRPTS